MTRYLVVLEKTTAGFGVYIPDLPGCVSTGETREQAEKNAREAIRLHLDGLREEGQPIPAPSSVAAYISSAA